jgi:hypothetical protein
LEALSLYVIVSINECESRKATNVAKKKVRKKKGLSDLQQKAIVFGAMEMDNL